jgi:hypothetical protein
VDRRFRIFVFAVIMGFLVFGLLFQMMFNTKQKQSTGGIRPVVQQETP